MPTSRPVDLAVGDAVRMVMTKWGERPHWEFDTRVLGDDEHGAWLAVPAGTPMARPGARFVTETDQACLVPVGAGWVATLHAPGYLVAVYVDMTGPASWDGARVTAVDLDLDVVRMADGSVVVDDEDEFAEHRVAFGYPPEVVRSAEDSCGWVRDAVLARRAPFDDVTAEHWLGRVAALP